jgi:serine/threonine protein kinase
MADLTGRIILNRYEVREFLGRGGMADVYKVWDRQRSAYLAMKLLRDDLSEDIVFLRRFRREAITLAKLQHPHIVRFYDLEEDGDLVFLLMDFIEGTTLRKEIARTKAPFSMERINEIMDPVCSALQYAHNMGLVHCDVKPANIMIHKNGTIFLTDFGIARYAEGATTMTMAGAGTPAYMAPEQIRGDEPTPQTDIYALGIVLYEMASGGERPFAGEQAQITGTVGEKIRWEQQNAKPPSLSIYNPNINANLQTLVFDCLEKKPEDRPLRINELQVGLNNCILGSLQNNIIEHKEENKDNGIAFKEIANKIDNQKIEINKKPNYKWLYITFGIGIIITFALSLIKINFGSDNISLFSFSNPSIKSTSTSEKTLTLIQPTRQPSKTITPKPTKTFTPKPTTINQYDLLLKRVSAFNNPEIGSIVKQFENGRQKPLARYSLDGNVRTNVFYETLSDVSPEEFVVISDVIWQHPTDNIQKSSSGCGYIFKYENDNSYIALFTLDNYARLIGIGDFWDGISHKQEKSLNLTSPNGSAQILMAVTQEKFVFAVNGKIILDLHVDWRSKGNFGYSLISGTYKDYGTRCTFDNTIMLINK